MVVVYTGLGYDDDEEEEISPDLWQEACWIVIRCDSNTVGFASLADLLYMRIIIINNNVYHRTLHSDHI